MLCSYHSQSTDHKNQWSENEATNASEIIISVLYLIGSPSTLFSDVQVLSESASVLPPSQPWGTQSSEW